MSPPRRRHQGLPHSTLRAVPRVAPLCPQEAEEGIRLIFQRPRKLGRGPRRMTLIMTQWCSPDEPTTLVLTMTSLLSTCGLAAD